MSERKIIHEIKLERSVKVILAIGALMLGLQVFAPALTIKKALADYVGGTITLLSGPTGFTINCSGCGR